MTQATKHHAVSRRRNARQDAGVEQQVAVQIVSNLWHALAAKDQSLDQLQCLLGEGNNGVGFDVLGYRSQLLVCKGPGHELIQGTCLGKCWIHVRITQVALDSCHCIFVCSLGLV